MSDTNAPAKKKRYTWIAVLLSLLSAGLGQIYCGKLARGLLFACLGALSIPVTAAMLANDVPAHTFTLAFGGLCGLLGITVIAAVDSYRLARRTKHDYTLKEYNRLIVYLLLYVMTKGGALGALLYTRDRLLEAFIVPAPSMCPTIQVGDRVLANKTAYDTADPRRGDMVIFRDPENWRRNCIKRIVAVEGNTVQIKNGRLIVNGKGLDRHAVPEDAVAKPASQGGLFREVNGDAEYNILQADTAAGPHKDFEVLTVPPYHCFVLGDNRNESHDSRVFGPIPLTSIIARADYLYWPAEGWSRFGRLDR